MKTGLPTSIKERIWTLKSVNNRTYSQIIEAFSSEGVSLTSNQVREVIREMAHGNRYGKNKEQIELIKINTMALRLSVLQDIEQIIKDAKSEKDLLIAIQGLKTKLQIAADVDRFERPIQPHTQINVLQIQMRDEKMERLFNWLIQHMPAEFRDEFERFVSSTDREIEAKYEILK